MTPSEKLRREAERKVQTGHQAGGGKCPACGHTWAWHWTNGCIWHDCECKAKRP